MPRLKVNRWADFQHYKDRSPPWIKLHKGLLDNFEYQRLPLASKALAPMFWLLASESDDGSIEYDVEKLAFRLRVSEQDIEAAIIPLINSGFLFEASDVLAGCLQDACLETEKETEKKAKNKTHLPKDFGISDRVAKWAEKNGYTSLESHLENFIIACQKKAYTYVDWDAAFMGAIRDNWAKVPAKRNNQVVL